MPILHTTASCRMCGQLKCFHWHTCRFIIVVLLVAPIVIDLGANIFANVNSDDLNSEKSESERQNFSIL